MTPNQVADPILVTGSHRSGTTWAGHLLAVQNGVAYVDEPFRPDQRPGIFDAGIDCWFAHAPDHDQERIREETRRLLDLEYLLSTELRAVGSVRDALRMGRDAVRFFLKQLRSKQMLLKDPIAVLSSAWLADEFDLQVVVMVRHPAAFAYSLKQKDWTFPFDHLLGQPRLMEQHLGPFRDEIVRFNKQTQPITAQAGLLWAVIYHTVSKFLTDHPDWIVGRHENLARNPVRGFRDLYKQLGLSYTPACRRAVIESSRSENPTESPDKTKDIHRDSRGLINRWRDGLSEAEIKTVREYSEHVAEEWYDRTTWNKKPVQVSEGGRVET